LRVLVNIRGTNGAGKSTIPLSMMDDPKMGVIGIEGGKRPYLTIFPTYGWIALGTYFNKTGGLDTYRTNEETRQALFAALEYTEMDILMEGVIASTVKSTYMNLFKDIQFSVGKARKIMIVSFIPPIEVCLERIYQRNGGKPIKEEKVYSKWRIVDRNVEYFRQHGFTSLRIDTSRVTKDQMLPRFLKTVNKYRGS
jgi:predicted ABC-type ATPase